MQAWRDFHVIIEEVLFIEKRVTCNRWGQGANACRNDGLANKGKMNQSSCCMLGRAKTGAVVSDIVEAQPGFESSLTRNVRSR